MSTDESAELLVAAELVADRCPRAATVLRALAELSPAQEHPKALRRRVLRRLWRQHYFDLSRTAAARLIAVQWGSWTPDGEELPGTPAAAFARLHAAGLRPLAWRQVADDLDVDLDPAPRLQKLQTRCTGAGAGA